MAETETGKLVAEMEVGGPIAFNTSMNDIITDDDIQGEEGGELIVDTPGGIDPNLNNENSNEPKPDAEIHTDPEKAEAEKLAAEKAAKDKKPGEAGDKKPPVTLGDEEEEAARKEKYKDYSEAALASEVLKAQRPDLFGEDAIKKDMKWGEVIENIDKYIANTLRSGQEHLTGQVGKAQEYVEFLLQGGDPKTLQTALQDAKWSKIDIETATDEQKEAVVTAMYKKKDLGESEIKTIVDNIKMGKKLDDKAAEAISLFEKEEKNIIKNAKEQKRLEVVAQQNRVKKITTDINKTIESGKILGLEIDATEQQEIKDMFLKPTEIMEVPDGKGGTITKRFTKYQVLEAEFKENIEMQIAFGKLLKDGFNLGAIKNIGKIERDKDLMNLLENKSGSGSTSRTSTRNAYLTP